MTEIRLVPRFCSRCPKSWTPSGIASFQVFDVFSRPSLKTERMLECRCPKVISVQQNHLETRPRVPNDDHAVTDSLRFAFYGRVSTEDNQDPTLSLPRQLANCQQAVERVGGTITAHYYDVESGDARLSSRGSGKGLRGFDIPIPRDGGLLDLLEDARDTRFEVVICESINRFARNPAVTFRSEEELRDAGVKLWAVDEPWEESFGSIVLRHVNVGLARGYLYELKVKSRQGIETAARQGRHAGGQTLYGYKFREERHPNPHKAAQGQKVKFLEPDEVRAPIVKMIFEDYITRGLSLGNIQKKLNSDLERFPPPESPDPARRPGQWGRSSVWEVLHNPKYTGYQVWNRRQRKRGGKINPSEKWIWSDEPAHDALVSREMFDKAALTGIRNDNATRAVASHEEFRKHSYTLRSFLKCGVCGLRMHGRRRRNVKYYVCETNRRQPGLAPVDHRKMVYVNEKKVAAKVVDFLQTRVFGYDRLFLMKAALDAEDPERDQANEHVERLTRELADLRARTRRLMASLEGEDHGNELLKDLKERLTELANLRAKKERELEAAESLANQRPDARTAEALMEALPLLEVDWELLSDEDFRQLLQILNFEARYNADTKELHVSVTLIPELLFPDDPANGSSLLFVPPGRHAPTR